MKKNKKIKVFCSIKDISQIQIRKPRIKQQQTNIYGDLKKIYINKEVLKKAKNKPKIFNKFKNRFKSQTKDQKRVDIKKKLIEIKNKKSSTLLVELLNI